MPKSQHAHYQHIATIEKRNPVRKWTGFRTVTDKGIKGVYVFWLSDTFTTTATVFLGLNGVAFHISRFLSPASFLRLLCLQRFNRIHQRRFNSLIADSQHGYTCGTHSGQYKDRPFYIYSVRKFL